MKQSKTKQWLVFLWDVFMCALGSYGGPEAHYGVFSSILVKKKKYINEEELTEMIGLYALVPGPSSTQTITAIGYYVGGPILALLTFLVWAFPAIVVMGLIGVFFALINNNQQLNDSIMYLPYVAVAFIIFAAIMLSNKVLKRKYDVLLYIIMLIIGLLFSGLSIWIVPIMLITGGLVVLAPHLKKKTEKESIQKPKWYILGIVIFIAIMNEILSTWFSIPIITLFTSFYRYGYSVIGGGQIVIPLMIQDLVQTQSLLTISDFLSGYAIDQAIPGPLFSFAAFVSSRSYAGSGISFLAGIIGGLSIFLPGILLVFFMFPIWKSSRKLPQMKHFLKGVSITAASLILMTAINQVRVLPIDIIPYMVMTVATILLLTRKLPAPLIVILTIAFGFVLSII